MGRRAGSRGIRVRLPRVSKSRRSSRTHGDALAAACSTWPSSSFTSLPGASCTSPPGWPRSTHPSLPLTAVMVTERNSMPLHHAGTCLFVPLVDRDAVEARGRRARAGSPARGRHPRRSHSRAPASFFRSAGATSSLGDDVRDGDASAAPSTRGRSRGGAGSSDRESTRFSTQFETTMSTESSATSGCVASLGEPLGLGLECRADPPH